MRPQRHTTSPSSSLNINNNSGSDRFSAIQCQFVCCCCCSSCFAGLVTHLSAIADDSLSVQVSAALCLLVLHFHADKFNSNWPLFLCPPPSIIQVASQKVGCLLLLLSSTATRGMGGVRNGGSEEGREGAIPSKLPQVPPSSLIR